MVIEMQRIERKQPVAFRFRGFIAWAGKPLVVLVAAFMLASCSPAEGLLPFSVCLIGVLWDKPVSYIPVMLGIIISALVRELSLFSVTMYCIPALLYLFCVNFLRVKKLSGIWWRMGGLVLCGLIGMLCTSSAKPYDIIMSCLSLIGGCALMPILSGALQAVTSAKNRSSFSRSELACMAVLVSALLLSVPNVPILGVSPMLLAALALIGITSLTLPTGESIAFACLCSVLFLLKGVPVSVGFVLVVSALLAGFFRDLGRFSALLGFVLADVLVSLCLTKTFDPALPLQTAALAAAPALLLGKKQLHILRGLGGSVLIPTSSEKELASRSIAEIDSRLTRCASVFNRLSQIFESSVENKRAKRLALCAGAASKVCSQCSKYEYCWKMRYSDTYSDFKELAGMICAAGSLSPYDVNKDFKARCVDWIGVLLNMNTENAQPEAANVENGNTMMAKQCRSIANMLLSLSKESSAVEYDYDSECKISAVLCENGYSARDVVCRSENGRLRSVTVTLHSCKGEKYCNSAVPQLLKQALGMDFICDERNCSLTGAGCSCSFVPAPRLRAYCHAACKVKDGQSVCGDSFSLLPLPGGRYLAAISDGMGSGNEAAAESENAVALLETLCLGQMEVRQAYDTVNELLQLRKKNAESFSTMDACVLDLFDGICSWGKIGAAPGYFVRSGRVQAVEGSSLPLGIVSKPEPSVSDRMIKEGDLLLLMSDGVYDALVNSCDDGITQLLPSLYDKEVNTVASELVKSALRKSGGNARDDMTVIAIKIAAA